MHPPYARLLPPPGIRVPGSLRPLSRRPHAAGLARHSLPDGHRHRQDRRDSAPATSRADPPGRGMHQAAPRAAPVTMASHRTPYGGGSGARRRRPPGLGGQAGQGHRDDGGVARPRMPACGPSRCAAHGESGRGDDRVDGGRGVVRGGGRHGRRRRPAGAASAPSVTASSSRGSARPRRAARPPVAAPAQEAGERRRRCADREARGAGGGETEDDDVAGHVGGEDMPETEISVTASIRPLMAVRARRAGTRRRPRASCGPPVAGPAAARSGARCRSSAQCSTARPRNGEGGGPGDRGPPPSTR